MTGTKMPFRLSRTALLLAGTTLPSVLSAQTLPTNGTVVAGAAEIAPPAAGTMQITQTSDRAIIEWQDFSVGEGGTVNILQPDVSSALLNRVTGDVTSVIAGTINANGQVYLVNPNGILITKTGTVNAGAFAASTLDIDNEAFMAGNGEIVVTAASEREVVSLRSGVGDLLGSRLSDRTLLLATVEPVEGRSGAALDMTGDGFLRVAVPNGGITVEGRINAEQVVLTAGSARDAVRGVVNLSGMIDATSVHGSGGTVRLTGESVSLAGATIDVSGEAGGGSVEIGGGYQGTGDLAHATTVTVDVDSVIRADATGAADGGSVVIWSDGKTSFAGELSARGGALGGKGGLVETSGKFIDLAGARVSTLGASGESGTWLIDPVNFTVAESGGDMTGEALTTALASNNVTIKSSDGARGTDGDIYMNDAVSWSANTLTLDAHRNVEINAVLEAAATAGFAAVVGDPEQDGIGSSSGELVFGLGADGFYGRLDLAATGSFSLNGTAYTIITELGEEGSRTGTDLQGINGNLSGNYVLGATIDAAATADWNGGAGFTALGTNGAGNVSGHGYSGDFIGLGHVIRDLTVNTQVDYAGLFGATASGATLADVGITSATITGIRSVGALAGDSRGDIRRTYATGEVTGFNNVGGLIGRSSGDVSGSHADTRVVGVAQDRVGAAAYVGGLIGTSEGSVIDSHATGDVSAANWLAPWGEPELGYRVGGLIGSSAGPLQNSYATGNVSGGKEVGGLVGYSYDAISHSYATGDVTGAIPSGSSSHVQSTEIGGLVGYAYGAVSASYATGDVSGDKYVGGLLGEINRNALTDSYATGAVSGDSSVGGLVGYNVGGSITGNHWDSYSTGVNVAVGSSIAYGSASNNVAVTSDPGQSSASNYAFKQSAYANLDFASNWFMINGATRPMGQWEHSTAITNAHQVQLMAMDLAADYTLTGNIDLRETGAVVSCNTDCTSRDHTGMWGPEGFSPVGDDTTPLSGSLKGQGHVIANLTIKRDANLQGLIGENSGAISNLGLVTAKVHGEFFSGTLVGSNTGTVSGSFVTGEMSGDIFVGGLVGVNTGEILASYTDVEVSGSGSGIGGLVGLLNGKIQYSYAVGSVSGTSYVGGLVGNMSSGSISDSYWDAHATGHDVAVGSSSSSAVNRVLAVTSDPALSHASNHVLNASAWENFTSPAGESDIDLVGGKAVTWRMYDGATMPMLKAFMTTATAASVERVYTGSEQTAPITFALANGGVADKTRIFGSAPGIRGTNVGTYTASVEGLYSTQQGYDIVSGTDAELVIVPAALTIRGDTSSTVYTAGVQTNGYSVDGLLGTDNVSSVSGLATGTDAGSYSDDLSEATGTGLENYEIAFVDGSLTIGKAALTITGDNTSTIYTAQEQTNGYSVKGLLGGDSVDNVSGLASGTDAATYADDLSGATGTGLGNYAITYVDGLIAITPAELTITGGTTSTIYTAGVQTNDYAVEGLLGSDTVENVSGLASATDVGVYVDDLSGATGTGLGNYAITYVDGSLDVGSAALTIAGNNTSTTYTAQEQTNDYSVDGLLGTDSVNSVSGLATATDTGSYSDDLSEATGTGLENYTITYVDGSLTIGKAELTITGHATSTTYAAKEQRNGYSVEGLLGTDTVNSVSGLAAGADAGTYTDDLSNAAGEGLENYAITYVDGSLAIARAALTITGDNTSTTYSATEQSNGYSVDGLLGADSVDGVSGLAVATDAGTYVDDLSRATGFGLGNYEIGYVDGSLAITPAELTITGNATSATYTAGEQTNGYVVEGLLGSDTVDSVSGLASATDAGTYVDDLSGATGTGLGNYAVAYVDGSLDIGKATLTITGANSSTTYTAEAQTNGYSVEGLLGADNVDGISGLASGTGAGVYADDLSSATGTGLGNYAITYVNGSLAITPAALTITGQTTSTIYTAEVQTNDYAVEGLLGVDEVDSVSGLASATDAGSYSDDLSRATGTGLANYAITYVDGSLTIGKAALTISGNNTSTTYEAEKVSNGYSVDGLLGPDSVESVLGLASATDVGTFADDLSGATGSGLENYEISYLDGSLAITRAPLTITGDTSSATYTAEEQSNGYSVEGLLGTDTVDGISGLASGTDAGIYADDLSGATGTGLGNYAITYVNGSLDIGKATLTITGANSSTTYTAKAQTNGYSVEGLLGTDTVDGISGLASGTDAGIYADDLSGATGTGLGNYAVTYVDGSLAITPAALTITGQTTSTIYTAEVQTNDYAVEGLLGVDEVDSVSGLASATDAGSYSDDLSRATGTGLSNYAITYVNGSLDIGKAALTISGNAGSATYTAQEHTNGYSVDGLLGTDSVGSVSGLASAKNVGSYSDDLSGAAGIGLANYAITYVNGSLAITPATLTITGDTSSIVYTADEQVNGYSVEGLLGTDSIDSVLGVASATDAGTYFDDLFGATGTGLDNYAVTYVNGSLAITPAALTVVYTADSLQVAYGETPSNLRGTYSATGLLGDDRLSGTLTWITQADPTSGVGTYAVAGSGLRASANYIAHYVQSVGNADALRIVPRPLKITADDVARDFGERNPALTYAVGGMGLVNGDKLTGGLTTRANAASDMGDYGIGRGTLAASSNYEVTYVAGTLKVTARPEPAPGTSAGAQQAALSAGPTGFGPRDGRSDIAQTRLHEGFDKEVDHQIDLGRSCTHDAIKEPTCSVTK